MKENIWENPKLIEVLKNGGVAVMPTDTIYGVVGLALNQDTVKRKIGRASCRERVYVLV